MTENAKGPQEESLRILGDAEDASARTKDTDFAGYSVPHPSEPLMNVRLQTTGRPALAVMDDGLAQLSSICDSLTSQLEAQEALATTRSRSESMSNTFKGPGRLKREPKE
ncbi:hypothetical protein JL722_7356 [Aureococcus anophagefferens]|nr:hypothetical protein JL722_7356 [Aureococcus anophagefferens]